MPTITRRQAAAVFVSILLLSSCAAQRAAKRGQRAMVREDWDKALSEFMRARAIDPENHIYVMGVERARLRASQAHFKKGQTAMLRGQLEEAVDQLEKATVLDPSNTYYVDELEKAHKDLKAKRAREDRKKSDIEKLKDKVKEDSPIVPELAIAGDAPVSLKFTDTDVKEVYNALGKLAGINILMDETIRDKRITIDLQDVTFEQGLDTLLLINLHYYKVIDEKTIIIIPDNQTKRRQYDELVIKTFYLSSADINEVQQLVQRLINTRFMSTSKQLNSITIRDTADKVAIAERIIEANDKAKAEVIIDVELLEINRDDFESLGVTLSSFETGNHVNQTLLEDDEDLGLQLSRIDKLTQNDWFLKFPTITYNALKRDSDTRLIAKPQMRVSEGEKANILIGDRVPVPTTTFNTNQTQGGNVIPITSFQYQDVGIKINFEPRVHHNKEVTLKLKVEVSQIIAVNTSGQPTIGTRTIETVIRLKEGETNLLAGLIRQDVARGRTGLPGLADIPLLGKLFSINTNDVRNQDLVLTLTPHIIRLPNITEDDLAPLYVGTEDNTSLRLGPRPVQSIFPTPEELGEEEGDDIAPPSVAPTDDDDDDDDDDDGDDDGDDSSGEAAPLPGMPGEGAEIGSETPGSSSEGGTEGEPGSGSEPGGEEPPPPSLPAVVTIQPARVETAAGGTFSVDVLIMQATNVGHVPFYVNYDATVLEYQGAVEGDFLRSGGASAQFQSASPSPGIVIFGCSRMGSDAGASGSGRLATMTFKALKAGSTNLSFSNNSVMSPAPGPLPSDWRGGQVNVQ